MLQPLQLEEVSALYAKEIPELREFLAKAGIPVVTGDAIRSVAGRLRDDRAFHRDLALHVWLSTHGRDQQVGYADQLGMLAVAAAGLDFASVADEGDAHDLLRFLMETRRSSEERPAARSEHSVVAAPVRVATEPVANPVVAAAPASEISALETQPAPVETHRAAEPQHSETSAASFEQADGFGRRRAVWMGVAACLLLVVILGLWFHHRSNTGVSSTPPFVNRTHADSAAAPSPTTAPTTGADNRAAADAGVVTAEPPSAGASLTVRERLKNLFTRSPRVPRTLPASGTSVATVSAPPSGEPVSGDAPALTSLPPATAAPAGVGPFASTNPPFSGAGVGVAAGSAPSAGPAATFGRPIVKPYIAMRMMPGDDGAAGNVDTPRLLRRRPTGPFAEYKGDAESAGGSGSSSRGGSAVRAGIVRQESLGMMAGNVLYSPLPAYPEAASAARVQGEVKIEAEVDRNGNVASARVVSGPPLLRDAALDAVQRWRYRPFTSGGKPISMNATAVVEFQLP